METFLMIITLMSPQGHQLTSAHLGDWETKEICIAEVRKVGIQMIKDPTTPWARSIANCIPLDEVKVMTQQPNT